ncbi:hypothetical protein ACLK1T_13525 [Escherichia coli]
MAPHMGLDVALMLGIAHTLGGKWRPEAFLAHCTPGYAVFASYLLGRRVNRNENRRMGGQRKFCGAGAAKIRELAAASTKIPPLLMAGWGMQRQQFGEQNELDDRHAGSNVGRIGTPGGGFRLSYHFANGGNPTRRSAVLSSMQAACRVAAMRWINPCGPTLLKRWRTSRGAYGHNSMSRHFPDIRFIYWTGNQVRLY